MRRLKRSWATTTALLMSALPVLACDEASDEPFPRAPADAIPASVHVGAAKLTSGFAVGKLRKQMKVDSFSITKHPITVKDYRRCVDAGVCRTPELHSRGCAIGKGVDGPTYSAGVEGVPVTCVTQPQASTYCRWIGGALPTAAQWQLAIRGKEVQRHAWGDDAADCDKHWRTGWGDSPAACCGKPCTSAETAVVGAHGSGAAASGVEDVLMTAGELIGPSDPKGACGEGGCIAKGIEPGAVDSFLPLGKPHAALREQVEKNALPRRLNAPDIPVASFRCVVEGA